MTDTAASQEENGIIRALVATELPPPIRAKRNASQYHVEQSIRYRAANYESRYNAKQFNRIKRFS